MFSSRNTGIGARLLAAAAAFAGASLAAPAVANAADVRVSISIGGHTHRPAPRPVVSRERDYAGTLTIDGHAFRINTCESVVHQVRDAFEHMGYHASCAGRSVRVSTVRGGPEVCWRNGDYTLQFRERRGSISITPLHDCDDDHYGHHNRYCFNDAHGRYFTYHAVRNTDHSQAHGHAAPITWTSVGASVFIDHDDHDDHHAHAVAGRTDDRTGRQARYQPNDRRTTAVPQTREVAIAPNVDLRKRTTSPSNQPAAAKARLPESKRSTAASSPTPAARPTLLPADRFGGLKPAQRTETARVNDATPKPNAPSTKASDNKRAKW